MQHLAYRVSAWVERHPLARFVVSVIALLPACFLIWYFLSAFLAGPAILLADGVLTAWLPDLVAGTRQEDAQFVVLSVLGEVNGGFRAAEEAGNQLGYAINTRTLSYSIPFFSALYFATPQRAGLAAFAWALLGLWLLLAIGLVSTALKDLMLGLGPLLLESPGVPPGDLIALLYQFSVLMVPPLAPVALWAYIAADSPAFRALFALAARPDQARDSAS